MHFRVETALLQAVVRFNRRSMCGVDLGVMVRAGSGVGLGVRAGSGVGLVTPPSHTGSPATGPRSQGPRVRGRVRVRGEVVQSLTPGDEGVG